MDTDMNGAGEQMSGIEWAEFTAGEPLTQLVLGGVHSVMSSFGKEVRLIREPGGVIFKGTLRHRVIGPDNFAFPAQSGVDVRDAWVRITLDGGMEVAIPMAEAAYLMANGMMAVS